MKLYESCSEIPILYFSYITTNHKTEYIIKDFEKLDEIKTQKFLENNQLLIEDAIENLINEYEVIVFNEKQLKQYKEEAEIKVLQATFEIAILTLNSWDTYKNIEVLYILNDLGFNFDDKKDIQKQVDSFKIKARNMQNKINIKNVWYKKKYDLTLEQSKSVKSEKIGIFKNLDSQALSLETNLELGYKINIKECSVVRWHNYMSLNISRIEAQEKI